VSRRNRGSSWFASESLEARIVLSNSAPALNTSGIPKLATIPRDDFDNQGTAIYDILRRYSVKNDLPITDTDPGALVGIAVTGADTAHGNWQYTTNNGATWNPLGAVSEGAARLLAVDSQTRLRFQPQPGFSGTVSNALQFRAWDQTTGVNGTIAAITASGGSTGFSAESETAEITVNQATDVLRGWGQVGDSNSLGYQFKPQRDTDRQWSEQLDSDRGFYFGEFQSTTWGPARDQGREFLWGAPRADLGLDPAALNGLASQIASGRVSVALYAWGSLNLFARVNDIFNGTLTGAPLEAFVESVVAEVDSSLQLLQNAGDAKVIVQEFADALAAPSFYLSPAFSNPVGRQRMADTVAMANVKIQAVADKLRIPVAKFYEISKMAVQSAPVVVGGVTLNQTAIRAFQHNPGDFFSDGLHTGTVAMGLHANMMLTALNRAYDTNVPLLSDQEILRNAGFTPDFSQQTYFDVSGWVHFNELVQPGTDSVAIDEGQTTTINVLANDVDPEGVPLTLESWTQPTNGTVTLDSFGKLVYTPNGGFNGTDEFTYQVSDSPLRSETGVVSITVNNVAPSITSLTGLSTEPFNGRAGQLVSLAGTILDPGTSDAVTIHIEWGDGQSSHLPTLVGSSTRSFAASHSYAVGGIYDVVVTTRDNDGGESIQTTQLAISGIGLQDGVLQVIGSSVDDQIRVNRAGSRIRVQVNSGRPEFVSTSDVTRIEVYAGAGDDDVVITDVAQPSIILGGSGDDRLSGGSGANVLSGGDGKDELFGGASRDILIGGRDEDRLFGGTGRDLLIGGRVTFENDVTALRNIQAEWLSSRSLSARIANLSGTGTGNRSNEGTFLVAGATVLNDFAEDRLQGGDGRDWLFANRLDRLMSCDPLLDWLTRF
jgi:Ca2+-binding RTX toxin-like protein